MDRIAEVKNEVQLRNWTELELARQRSGKSVKEWCEQEQLSRSGYYYRLRKVRENLCRQAVVPVGEIPECIKKQIPAIRIRYGEVSVELEAETPAETIAAIIRALQC